MQESGVDLRCGNVIHEADMTDKSNARPEKVYVVRTSPLSRWALACTSWVYGRRLTDAFVLVFWAQSLVLLESLFYLNHTLKAAPIN